MNNRQLANGLLAAAVILIIGFLAWKVLKEPDQRGIGERLDDAVSELNAPDNRGVGQKLDDASEQMRDRTPAEKISNEVQDIGNKIQGQ